MTKVLRICLMCCAVFLAGAIPSAPAPAQDGTLVVFAAASLKNALDAVNAQWQKDTGKQAKISYAASSALAKQIEQGAPAQMFVSADIEWMNYLAQKNLIKADTRANLLGNRLVIVAPKDRAQPFEIKRGFDLAKALGDGRLAMANVDAVPAGRYGKAALTALGLWDSVADKTAQAENVRAAFDSRVARRGAAGHRLPDRRRLRSERGGRRHVPRRHAPADHLSHRPHHRPRPPRRRGLARLHPIRRSEIGVRGARVHGAEPRAVVTR